MNNKPSEKETELNGEDVGVLGTMFLRTGHFFSYGVYCYMPCSSNDAATRTQ